MPLWLDLLRTPMAAPETVKLRRMRIIWQVLCILTAVAVGCIAHLRGLIGKGAPFLAAVLIFLTLVHSVFYWASKQRADNALLGDGEDLD